MQGGLLSSCPQDWQRHSHEAGLTDLNRDPHAGHIERAESRV